ncbi:hypothetical protein GCM10027277_38980 [Pseudoduganella ginsengisoli]|uniref:Uncharacterized protein n=1 Tax=Pseudoduganella ginsengisoli TaxID=1462440 RepID=A0A6L6PX52_9BURK|nr:hypothetical protein [Pseudoduganella ginsengisoli]MTW02030.1 hypothetical protein [Pseudoduganella ginsengisoli]
MKKPNAFLDAATQENILAVTRSGVDRDEATGFFRVALGLHYLSGLMTKEKLDFAALDREYNRFIYHAIGKGHSITSILQYMSGEKVIRVVDSPRFLQAFHEYCDGVPVQNIPFLLGLNLGVAKDLSGIDVRGPVADWIEKQRILREEREAELAAQALREGQSGGL